MHLYLCTLIYKTSFMSTITELKKTGLPVYRWQNNVWELITEWNDDKEMRWLNLYNDKFEHYAYGVYKKK